MLHECWCWAAPPCKQRPTWAASCLPSCCRLLRPPKALLPSLCCWLAGCLARAHTVCKPACPSVLASWAACCPKLGHVPKLPSLGCRAAPLGSAHALLGRVRAPSKRGRFFFFIF